MEIKEIVEKVNKLLEAGEPRNIQEIKGAGGRIIHGYKPQYLIDALNSQYPLWKMEWKILDLIEQKNSTLAIVEVEIEILGIVRKQVGQSTNMNKGDSIKGAITDGIAKCLSLFSIGYRAFRGELGKPNKTKPKQPPKQENKNAITDKQQKRLFAIAKKSEWSLDDLKEFLNLLGIEHSNEIPKGLYDRIIEFIENNKSAHEDLKEVFKLRAEKEGFKSQQFLTMLGDVADEDLHTALSAPEVWGQIVEDYKEEMKKNNPEMDF